MQKRVVIVSMCQSGNERTVFDTVFYCLKFSIMFYTLNLKKQFIVTTKNTIILKNTKKNIQKAVYLTVYPLYELQELLF